MDNIVLKNQKVSSHYEWVTYPNGEQAYLYTQKIPFIYNDKDIGILCISRDLTELYNIQIELRNQTYIDELTKINNRKSYNKRLAEILSEFKRYKIEFSMVMFDIDDFKSINDTYGHKVGDDVLIGLCKMVSSNIRKNDYFFRIGGEEFVILLSNTNLSQAILLSDKIRDEIEKKLNIIDGRVVTISMGVAKVLEDDDEKSIFKRVDSYLYKAKRGGKNRLVSDLN
ncbi:MAG: diguanylate cyclase [Campylobacterales bacterium]|nr:diguanylate cyclase [Campylobacterales bacterium]